METGLAHYGEMNTGAGGTPPAYPHAYLTCSHRPDYASQAEHDRDCPAMATHERHHYSRVERAHRAALAENQQRDQDPQQRERWMALRSLVAADQRFPKLYRQPGAVNAFVRGWLQGTLASDWQSWEERGQRAAGVLQAADQFVHIYIDRKDHP